MPLRIGANPIGWSNDDLRTLGGDTPLETCLAEARSVGFEGMELGHKFPREPQALRVVLAPFNLACISGWWSGALLSRDADAELEAMRPHLDLLRAMGSDVLVFAETTGAIHGEIDTPLSRRPTLPPDAWTGLGARLTALADATARNGIRLVYHHHMGTVVQSEADIHALMAATGPAVGLLLDTGHATWGGADPASLAARYRDRIWHVHAKDVRRDIRARADAEDWSFLHAVIEGVYTVPGDGLVDYRAVFAALPGYDGWVVIEAEQDPARANPLLYARKGYAHLCEVLADVGLREAA